MSVTVTAANIPSQAMSPTIAMTLMNAATFSAAATDTKKVGGTVTQTSVYRYMANAWGETELEVKHVVQPVKSGSLNQRHSFKLRTNVKYTDTNPNVPEVTVPYEVVIAWNSPSNVALDVGSMSRMIQALAGLVLSPLDPPLDGIPVAGAVTHSSMGITQNL